MDRLISEQAVIDAIAETIKRNESVNDLLGRILAIPSAEPYKGMTNGEVMKKNFKGVIHHIDGQPYLDYCYENQVNAFTLDWWNSPYSEERSDKE